MWNIILGIESLRSPEQHQRALSSEAAACLRARVPLSLHPPPGAAAGRPLALQLADELAGAKGGRARGDEQRREQVLAHHERLAVVGDQQHLGGRGSIQRQRGEQQLGGQVPILGRAQNAQLMKVTKRRVSETQGAFR